MKNIFNYIEEGDIKKVKQLIKSGVDINIRNNVGSTILMLASYNGHKEIVKILIENGADVNLQNRNGWTALMCVCDDKEIVELLINAGANINIKDNNGLTALELALYNECKEIVEFLDVKNIRKLKIKEILR